MSLLKKLTGLFGKDEDPKELPPATTESEDSPHTPESIPDADEDTEPMEEAAAPASSRSDLQTLHECAATPGSAARCHELLENGADPLKNDAEGRSALHVAAIHGNLEVLKELKEHVISVDPFDMHRLSPLMSAIRAEQDDAAQLLIQQGAKLTLNVAFALGDLLLINRHFSEDKDAFKNCKAPDELITDYATAIRRECDKKIAAEGASSEEDKIAIEDKVFERHEPILERLIDMGCHPDTFDSAGRPALFQAVQFHSTRFAQVLLEHDANPDFEADDGQTPLGAATDKRPAMQALLKEHGAEEYGGQPHEPVAKKEKDEPGVGIQTIKTNHPSPWERKSRPKR